jgi:hypothetical protein
VPTVRTPTVRTPTSDTNRGSGSSGQPQRPRRPAPQPPRQRPHRPAARVAAAGLPRTRSRQSGTTVAPRRLRLRVCAGHLSQVDPAGGDGCPGAACRTQAVRTRGHRTRPAGHRTRPAGHQEPARLALRTPATAAWRTDAAAPGALDSRQQNRGIPQPCPTGTARKVRPRPPCRLTARSVAWCSTSIWSAPDGSALLTFGCLVDRVGSRRVPSDRLDDQADDQGGARFP